jgi:WD40 repeat protein
MTTLTLAILLLAGHSPAQGQERTLSIDDGFSVRCIAFSPDGKLLLTGHGTGPSALVTTGHVKVWDVKSGKVIALLKGTGPVGGIDFSPDGKTVVAGWWWEAQSWKRLRTPKLRGGFLAFSPDGHFVVSAYKDKVFVEDAAGGDLPKELHGHASHVQHAAFSHDGKTLATVGWSDPTVILWDTATWKKKGDLPVGVKYPKICFSPRAPLLFVSGDEDQPVSLWDIEKGKRVTTGAGEECVAWSSAAFSPDGRYVAAVDGYCLSVWDVRTGKQLALVKGPDGTPMMCAVAFSPDGQSLATGIVYDRGSFLSETHSTVKIFAVDGLLKERRGR